MDIKKLKTIRKRAGFNQKYLAEHLGLAQSTVSNWETGRRIPSTESMRKLINLYRKNKIKITADELMFRKSKRKK